MKARKARGRVAFWIGRYVLGPLILVVMVGLLLWVIVGLGTVIAAGLRALS